IAVDTIEVTTGLIFLEAGETLAFTGYTDDSLRIEIAGNTVLSTTGDAWGVYNTATAGTINTGGGSQTSTGPFTAPVNGYYTIEFYVFNHNGPGDLSIRVIKGGNDVGELNSNNNSIRIYEDIDEVDLLGGQHSEFVAGPDASDAARDLHLGGYYPIELNKGGETAKIKLSGIDAQLIDADGSEQITGLVMNNIPLGWKLFEGDTELFTASAGNQSYDLSGLDLHDLHVVSTNTAATGGGSTDYTLQVTATTEESATSASEDTSVDLVVTIFDTVSGGSSPLMKAASQSSDLFIAEPEGFEQSSLQTADLLQEAGADLLFTDGNGATAPAQVSVSQLANGTEASFSPALDQSFSDKLEQLISEPTVEANDLL
ncbi:MAG: hypothetical protein OIF35_09670, partial [Cellvibrionaceae bacterium]|nr:hypothetical protein [Cellvibrionaceae bacterium]